MRPSLFAGDLSVLAEAGGDDGHGVDLGGVAAAGEVVDGGVEAQEHGAVGIEVAQALGDLVADVAGVDLREDEGVGVACHGGAGELQLAHHGGDGGVELHLAVDVEVGVGGLDLLGGLAHLVHGGALAGAVGGVAQHGHLGLDAEGPGAVGALGGDLHQLVGGGIDVDGAVAHGDDLAAAGGVGAHQDHAGGDDLVAGLGLHQLQGGTDGVGGGVGGAAQQAVGLAHLHQHGAEVVALLQGLAALLGGHLALAELHHRGHHLIHAGIGGGVDDLGAANVEAAVLGGGLHGLLIAHEDGGQEGAGEQTGGCLQDAGVGALGEDDGPGMGLQLLNEFLEHSGFPSIKSEFPAPRAGGSKQQRYYNADAGKMQDGKPRFSGDFPVFGGQICRDPPFCRVLSGRTPEGPGGRKGAERPDFPGGGAPPAGERPPPAGQNCEKIANFL